MSGPVINYTFETQKCPYSQRGYRRALYVSNGKIVIPIRSPRLRGSLYYIRDIQRSTTTATVNGTSTTLAIDHRSGSSSTLDNYSLYLWVNYSTRYYFLQDFFPKIGNLTNSGMITSPITFSLSVSLEFDSDQDNDFKPNEYSYIRCSTGQFFDFSGINEGRSQWTPYASPDYVPTFANPQQFGEVTIRPADWTATWDASGVS